MKKIMIVIVIMLAAALLAYAANIPPVVTGCRVTEVSEPVEPNDPLDNINETLKKRVIWKYEMFERVANNWQQEELSKAK